MRKEYIAWFSQGKHGESTMPIQELVRCKECRHYKPFDKNKPYSCSVGMDEVTGDDYCPRGARMDEETGNDSD